jgi:YVTN family beta-propeller protein
VAALLSAASAASATSVIATVPVGYRPHGVAVNPLTNRIYVSNAGDTGLGNSNTVSVINGADNTVVATITVGSEPFGVAVHTGLNRVYVSNRFDGTVSVIDGATNGVVATIPLPGAVQPEEIAVNKASGKIYVANWSSSNVSVINTATNAFLYNIAVGSGANGATVNAAANRIYVSNFYSNSISIIDGSTDTVVDSIAGVNSPNGLKYDALTNRLYVTNFGPDTLTVFDATTKAVLSSTTLGPPADNPNNNPDGVAASVLGNKVYVSLSRSALPTGRASVVNLVTGREEETLTLQNQPREADINTVTRRIYIPNFGSNVVSVLADPSECCDLVTSQNDIAGPPADRLIRVVGTNRFVLDFRALTGGSIVRLADLESDPGGTLDLAGGEPAWNSYPGLFFDSIWYGSFPAGAVPTAWYGWSAGDATTPDTRLDLIEATATRTRVRSEVFFHHSLTQGADLRMPGMKGFGDYSIYGVGRLALKWKRQTTIPVTWGGGAGAVGSADLDWTIHKDPSVPELNTWSAYRPGGALPPNTNGGAGSGADDFLLLKSDYTATTPNVRADLLATLYTDWADAQVTAHNDTSAGSDKAAWVAWDDTRTGAAGPHIRNWVAGQSETFNFLTSFRPTSLLDHTDTAVTTRASDYRSPATITLTYGTRWADADENTPTGSPSDYFNESEGAYLFDFDPSQGLKFEVAGSLAAPRYKPFFKVRQWRSLQDPTVVALGSVPLVNGVDYSADVKPVSRAYKTNSLSWHCTLQDAASCDSANIDVGSGGGLVLGSSSIQPGRYGNGLSITSNDAYVFAPATDFDFGVGALEFWYRPNYDSTSGSANMLWQNVGGTVGDYDCFWLEHTGGNLVLRAYRSANDQNCNLGGSAVFTITATGADYYWKAGDWVHIRAEWDSGSYMRLYVEGRRVGSAGGYSTNLWDAGQTRIGSCQITCPGGGGSRNADGTIDEPHLYVGMGASGNPETLAYGGLVGDGRELLADPASNLTLLTFSVGAGRKGQYLYLGADSRFRGLNVDLSSPGGGIAPGALVWQYWRDNGAGGEGWADLEGVAGFSDGTLDFTQDGAVSWNADPADWKPYSVNGGPDLFYVRVYLSGYPVDYSPSPVESVVKTDILLFQYCGDVTSSVTFTIPSPATTAVKLMSFAAVPGDASVVLEWRTGSELDNLGFHLYRGLSADGPWTRLTSTLISGLGSSPLGQAYSWQDTGLVNGTRYYYRLEDVDTASKSTFHGPVSATPDSASTPPGEGGGGDGGGDGTEGGGGETAPGSCPSWVLAAAPDAVSPTCTKHGDPDATSFQVLARGASSATVELRTGGFWALREAAGEVGGEVRVFVPGLEFPSDPKAAALPVRRALVPAVVGKQVQLVSAEAFDLQSFPGLRPSAVGASEMAVGRDGTVRPARRAVAARFLSRGYVPQRVARLSGTVFQGESKSAVVEIVPVRVSVSRNELVLASRVRVRLRFAGEAAGEVATGEGGRVLLRRPRREQREVLAQLHTSRRGLHAVRYEEVLPTDRRGVSTTRLRLQRQGEAVAFRVEPAGAVFGPGSVLYFHADRTAGSTEYSGEVAYELVRGSGAAMGVVTAAPAGPPVVSSSRGFASFETNRIYQPGLLEAPDIWLWEGMSSGVVRAKPFTVEGVARDSGRAVRLAVELQGGSDAVGTESEHHVRVSVNGVDVGEASFGGKRPYRLEAEVSASVLREGGNELSVANVGDTGVYSLVFLDRFELSYPQVSTTHQGVFEGVWTEGGTVEVGGLSGRPLILRGCVGGVPGGSSGGTATGKGAPRDDSVSWVTGFEVSGSSVRFRADGGCRYTVVSADALLKPRVEGVSPSTLKAGTNRAEYLVIAPREFLGAAQGLVERRRSQGLVARAVSFEQIASEFGHGQASADAIRGFLRHAYHSWQRPSPRYVVLLGDATYDPRRFLTTSWASPLPALWMKTSYLWTASDPALAAVNGEDLLPDLAIGRLPATTVEQAEALVSKLLAWEDSGQDLFGNAVLVADTPDVAGDFEWDVEDIRRSFLSDRSTTTLRVRELGSATRPAILGAFDEGASVMSYVGHGGAAVWSSSNVLSSWDTPSLRAQSRQPLLLTLNCLNGYFVAPNFDSLSESLVKAEGRGAIAAVSPSGLSLDGPAHQYHKAVMAELVSGRHERLGDALLAAQAAYAQTGLMPELLAVYQLLGDPATRVRAAP